MPTRARSTLGRTAPHRQITVASVPASHVYVRHIAAVRPDGVARLPDPDPAVPGRSTEQTWWPPVMLDPAWVHAHAFDVFHVHFGFDAWDPRDLAAVADAVHRSGRMLAYTVHDLRNPHHESRALHDAQLDVLVAYADVLLTLTDGAADEVLHRWGRRPHVVPHPHIVELSEMARAEEVVPPPRDGFRVGLHVKSLRASMDPRVLLPTLVNAVRELPGGVLRVDGHPDLLEPGGARYDAPLAALLRAAHAEGDLELHVHDFFSDDDLITYLRSLDASVLPYRFGTHSGWLEACRDVGTAVIAPTCGYYADQGPVHSFVLDEEEWGPDTLRAAVHAAYDAGPPTPLTAAQRRSQRDDIAAAHRRLYGIGGG